MKQNAAAIPEGEECEGVGADLDKSFGFSKQFTSKYEIAEEVGRGHFGYTCSARFKKGELKGQKIAVKVIPKAKVCHLTPSLIFWRRNFFLINILLLFLIQIRSPEFSSNSIDSLGVQD